MLRIFMVGIWTLCLSLTGCCLTGEPDPSAAGANSESPAVAAAPPKPTGPIVDIRSLAGKSKEDVTKALGKPSRCEDLTVKDDVILSFDHCVYSIEDSRAKSIQVDFIFGDAEFFELSDVEAPVSPESLRLVGLNVSEPNAKLKAIQTWNGKQGFHFVSMQNMGDGDPTKRIARFMVDRMNRSDFGNDQKLRKKLVDAASKAAAKP